MAPKFLSRFVIFAFVLSLCIAAIPVPVLAASPSDPGHLSSASAVIAQQLNHRAGSVSVYQNEEQPEIKQQVFRIYIDPALVPNMDFAKAVLPKYVEDMNTILAKNTNRQLVFDPETDIIITSTQPFSNQAATPLPVDNFEIWANALPSNCSFSYGGYAGVDASGAAVLAGLRWARLYNPDEMTRAELTDYWTQINNMLHELAHVYGAGIGEYYKLSHIQDETGASPFLNINIGDPNDSFWKDKPDFMADPLLRNAVQISGLVWTSRESLLSFAKYSDLTATIINSDYRNTAPMVDLQHVNVSIVDNNGAPIDAANVKIWSVVGNAPYHTQLLADAFSDANGQVSFAWGGSTNPHNNYDFLRLIKVYKDGYLASAKYISIFDADIVKLVDGISSLRIAVLLNSADTPPTITEGNITDVAMSENGSSMPFNLTLHATDVDNGDTISWSISTPASHGTASATGTGTSKSILYNTSTSGYTGPDSFTVQVSDGRGGTDTITVNVMITSVEPPSFTIFLPIILR